MATRLQRSRIVAAAACATRAASRDGGRTCGHSSAVPLRLRVQHQRRANAFLNFNCVILDVAHVEIGRGTQIGPAVQIYAAEHPRDEIERRNGLELGRAVVIGRDVWVGGGAIILPGVRVGDGCMIGAGSVVTAMCLPE